MVKRKVDFNTAWDYLMEKREKAPRCIVCDILLFDRWDTLDDYFFQEHNCYFISSDEMNAIYRTIMERYPIGKESGLHRHHVDYKKNIQVPVCGSCHSKIHNGNDPKLIKWLPVNKKPKGQMGFDSNVYKPLH
jgi:hypothetical protein